MNSPLTIILLFFGAAVGADMITYICAYSAWSNKDRNHPAKKFNLTFIVDSKNETAYMLGDLRTSRVVFLLQNKGTNFLEMIHTRNMYTTTIDDSLNSVHGRHSSISS